ncbi:MAG: hypothetical protein ACLQVD_12310, partial [Capsulimonadaceae bacterium]
GTVGCQGGGGHRRWGGKLSSRGRSSQTRHVAAEPGFGRFLSDLEKGMVVDQASHEGTAALTSSFVDNPESRDFIVTYENLAYQAARSRHDLVAIYPNPTEVAEQSVCVLDAPWVSPDQAAGARAFMDYLGRAKALMTGEHYNMRPDISTESDDALDQRLAAAGAQGFQQTYTSEESPPYYALNTAAALWYKQRVR